MTALTRRRRTSLLAPFAAVLAILTFTSSPGVGQELPPPLVASASPIGFETFEPTIGATRTGDLYFSTTPGAGVAVGWSASIAKSTNKGATWTDAGPKVGGRTMPPETNDPYIYVDPGTGRVFTFHMAPILLCSIASYSDNGGTSWTTAPGCSPTGAWDHQTYVAAKPRTLETVGYPNVLHSCVNAIYAAMCSRSIDGGLTWQPSVSSHVNDHLANGLTGAQTGHLAAAPDGTVYLPTSLGGQRPTVYVSRDDGLTWTQRTIANVNTPFVDPSVSVDSAGNVHAAYIDESGWLYYAVSKNLGETWSAPVKVAEGMTANMPVITAGDPGKVAIAYPGTMDLVNGYATSPTPPNSGQAWHAYFSVSYNGLDAAPSFETVSATGTDPIGRGSICVAATRCAFLVDFIESVLGPDGYPYASFVDGCIGQCATKPTAANKSGTGVGLMTTLISGPKLCETACWQFTPSGPVAASFGAEKRLDALTVAAATDASRSLALDTPKMNRLRARADRARVRAVLGLDR